MYYAMIFIQNEWGMFNVRALRTKGYKSEVVAKRAIEKANAKGYVKKLGNPQPIWSN